MNLSHRKKSFLLTAVLYIFFGLLLCFWPEPSRRFIFILIGICLLLYGALHIYRFFQDKNSAAFFQFDLVSGLTATILGAFLFFRPNFPDTLIPFTFGITLMINGLIKLQYAITMKKFSSENWKWLLVFAAILIVIGLILILFPIALTNVVTIFIGLAFLFGGVSDIVSYFQVKSFYKHFSK